MNSELQVIYHRDTVEYHSSKHPEERVYFWRFPIPGVWKCGQTLSWMYDISSQSKLKLRRQRWNKSIIKSTPNKTRDLNVTLGTLSSGNADGDGDAETCEKAGERKPKREFTNIKQHRRKPRFLHCQAYWHCWYSSSVYQDELGWLHWKEFAINSW